MGDQPSEWQQRIEGEWHGAPSVFDAEGNHVGYESVFRSSVFEAGKTTYYMNTKLDARGELRARFELADQFAFEVEDSDVNRLYLGPDFFGAGQPYGGLVDAHYYSPAWAADLRTMVHVLDDGQTQVYSSLLYDGPAICAVFNGVYKVAFDYAENPETQARIDAFVASERDAGPTPHVLPTKNTGSWRGELEVYGPDQKPIGSNRVEVRHEPLDLLRARQHVTHSGVFDFDFALERTRNSTRHTFHGPDAWGNAKAYGRALYTSQHLHGGAWKVKSREFIIDQANTMSLCSQWYDGEKLAYIAFGLLEWQQD